MHNQYPEEVFLSREPVTSRTVSPFPAVDYPELRAELTHYANLIKNKGLTSATGGNISYRSGDDMLISPSGYCLDEIRVEDWVRVRLETAVSYPNQLNPSSETLMHCKIYGTRPDANAIVHSHPPHVIALSLLGIPILPIGSESLFLLGESVPLIPYAIPTSPLLAEAVGPYSEKHNVMILENHGLVTLGKDNREAYYRTELSEEIARIMQLAISLGRGEPKWPTVKDIQDFQNWVYNHKLPEDG